MIYTIIILYLLGLFLTHKTCGIATMFIPESNSKYVPYAIWICAIFWPILSLTLLIKKPR